MKTSHFLKALGLVCGLAFLDVAIAKEDKASEGGVFESDKTVKISGALFVTPVTEGFTFTLEPPSFFSYSLHEGLLNDKIGLYLDYTSIRLRNYVNDDLENRLNDSTSHLFSLGLMRRTYHQPQVATFIKIGASLLKSDIRLTDKENTWGVKVSFGCEYIYEYRSLLKPTHMNKASFFVETSYNSNSLRAEKISGEPTLFDDIAIAVGSRSFY